MTGNLDLSFSPITDDNGQPTGQYHFVGSASAGISIDQTFIRVPISIQGGRIGSAPTLYWNDPGNWDNPVLHLSNSLNITTLVFGAATANISVGTIVDGFNSLINGGPTERDVTGSIRLFSTQVPSWEFSVSAGTRMGYDVFIPSGADVSMNQNNVTLESLAIASGGSLGGNSTLRVRRDVVNSGNWYSASGIVDGTVINSGNRAAGRYMSLQGSLQAAGGVQNLADAEMRVTSYSTINGPFVNSGLVLINGNATLSLMGSFQNDGPIGFSGSSAVLTIRDRVSGTGTVTIPSGCSLSYSGSPFGVEEPIVLLGGTFRSSNAQGFTTAGAGIVTGSGIITGGAIGGHVVASGQGALITLSEPGQYNSVYVTQTGVVEAGSGATVELSPLSSGWSANSTTNFGTVRALDGGTLRASYGYVNHGNFEVQADGTFLLCGGLSGTGVLRLRGGRVLPCTPGSTPSLQCGTVTGHGQITGQLSVTSGLDVSSTAGPLVINGSLSVAGTATLSIDLSSTITPLSVSGPVALGGRLRLTRSAGHSATRNMIIPLITATGGITGGFSQIESPPGTSVSIVNGQLVVNTGQSCSLADVGGLGGAVGPDGNLTADDIVLYLQSFFAGTLNIADVASLGGSTVPDGQLTADDIVVFLAAFFAACS